MDRRKLIEETFAIVPDERDIAVDPSAPEDAAHVESSTGNGAPAGDERRADESSPASEHESAEVLEEVTPVESSPIIADTLPADPAVSAEVGDEDQPQTGTSGDGLDDDEDAARVEDIYESAGDADVEPLELIEEPEESDEEIEKEWYILKVAVNRETTVCAALERRVKVAGLEKYFAKILVPTEEVREFTKAGKPRTVKRKLYPGYIVVNMAINDETWFLVRDTPGIGDFTGAAGKPTPMSSHEIESILRKTEPDREVDKEIKTTIKHSPGDRVRVKEGYFQNFEGDVESVDEANGRITVIIQIFNRSTPVEVEHWQVEDV